MFIILFTRSPHRSLSWARQIKSTSGHSTP